jgi:ATP-dependent Clp protease ATP-binding subunit ClpC
MGEGERDGAAGGEINEQTFTARSLEWLCMGMFDHFTDRTRKIMALANRAAHQRGTGIIGDLEMLLGLLEEGDGVGAKILRKLGHDLNQMHHELFGKCSLLSAFRAMGPLPQTPEAKQTIEAAIAVSASLGQKHVGSGHFLLAMTMTPNSAAGKALIDRAVTEVRVREMMEQVPQASQ